MGKGTKTADLRRQILKGRKLAKQGKKLVTYDDVPAPYHKTQHMKYVELKFGAPLEDLIMNGSNREAAERVGVDYSTISKWRKIIEEAG